MLRPTTLSAMALALLLSQPVSAQESVDARRPAKKPFAAFSASAQGLRDSLVGRARSSLGTKYVWGGNTPGRGIDCSGLVKYVLSALHLDVPRTADLQSRVGEAVPRDPDALQPGDVLTFGSKKKIDHVGVYVGNGRFIHASPKGKKVIESALDNPASPLIRKWAGVRRFVPKVMDSLFAERDTTAP
jgi:cell wall-associated NlpC family hydrolase